MEMSERKGELKEGGNGDVRGRGRGVGGSEVSSVSPRFNVFFWGGGGVYRNLGLNF